ncbi:MAG: hypothetical protein NYU90_01730 [Aigarchaeota archaeon]|nr:hypothetical protein [Candidatus Calditenuis fumarioli]
MAERIAKLEVIVEEHRKILENIDRRFERLESRIDRYFWLWVTTLISAILLKIFGYL